MSTSDNIARPTEEEVMTPVQQRAAERHDFDEDAVCIRCGFDGAEWWHLEKLKPKEERNEAPSCDREPPDPDGECYRGREYASALAEQQAQAKRFK
jgi:hypothetical protein